MLYQFIPIMMFMLVIAVVSSVLKEKKEIKKEVERVKTYDEAVQAIKSHDGWVLITVDTDKCGYCEAAKIMLLTKGIKYSEVNVTDLSDKDLEKLTNYIGVSWVPALLYVSDGRILFKKGFEGVKEKDVIWVRALET